jgi:hypothetical protein
MTTEVARLRARSWASSFERALHALASHVPGLNCHTTQGYPQLGSPRLFWDDDPRGAYWASAGLVHTDNPSTTLTTATGRLHYIRESPDGETFELDEYPLRTLDIGTTDPDLVAAFLIEAAKRHFRRDF